MSKKRIITFVVATLVASALFYFVAIYFSAANEDMEQERIREVDAAKCIQCEYLPEGEQQNACFIDYGCRPLLKE